MNAKILIDIGSSTVKVYKLVEEELRIIAAKSLPFKTEFEKAKRELFSFINDIKKTNPSCLIKTFATAFYRKLDKQEQQKLIDEFFENTGLYFNIISHELENFYLQKALIGRYTGSESLLLINIGGGSTELVVIKNNKVLETVNIDLGVGTILQKFSEISDQISGIDINQVKEFVNKFLPDINHKVSLAFYSGGELNYMKLAKYNLEKNNLFSDEDHPSVISLENFEIRNLEVFLKTKLEDLEKLMPENPSWMHGARSCSAIAEAICDKYNIQKIIPSDSNLINGVVRQEFRTVTLSGSFRKHLEYILKFKKELENKNVEVLSPRFIDPKNPGEEFVVFSGEEDATPLQLERHHLDAINKSDALIVCAKEGYVGASAMLEIGYANQIHKRIIFTENPEEFMLNTLPAEVGL